jgi:hypothetical protein
VNTTFLLIFPDDNVMPREWKGIGCLTQV